MTEQPTLDALTQQRDREYLERLLAHRTRALTRVIAERDEARAALKRVNAIADSLVRQNWPLALDLRAATAGVQITFSKPEETD